jgi:proteasome assembly chaperone (PAC2) family protein
MAMSELLEIRRRPWLNNPVLVAAFDGWGNAGESATEALDYLLGDPKPEPCAVISTEECFDLTSTRPVTKRGPAGDWRLILPTLACYPVRRPNMACDLLVFTGPEPTFRWVSLSRELAAFAIDCRVQLFLTFGAFIGPTSHRHAEITGRTLNPTLSESLGQLGALDTSYEGPTAAQTALLHAAHEAGLPAASLWVASAPYIQGSNPRAALALLEMADSLGNLGLDLTNMRGRSAGWVRRLDAALANNPNLAAQLGQLVDLGDGIAAPATEPDNDEAKAEDKVEGELPSGSDLVEELERFLRGQKRPPEEPQS